MGRTTIKSRKGREETQTITTDKTENEWTRNINNSDEQEGTQNSTDKHRATHTDQPQRQIHKQDWTRPMHEQQRL